VNQGTIQLRGVRVHNLRNIDLEIPHGQWVALCGKSGSGKSSLAIDTLLAEGKRRYIESFSAYTRQFLEKWDKPDAESIDGILPAISVRSNFATANRRATVGTATETIDYIRLLFAKIASIVCPSCGAGVSIDSPAAVAEFLAKLPPGHRIMVAFPLAPPAGQAVEPGLSDAAIAWLYREGFRRVIHEGRHIELTAAGLAPPVAPPLDAHGRGAASSSPSRGDRPARLAGPSVVVDRWITGRGDPQRIIESLETAFYFGHGSAQVLVAFDEVNEDLDARWTAAAVDDGTWHVAWFSQRLECRACGLGFPRPDVKLFNYNNALGACPTCEGFGGVAFYDIARIVPDGRKSLRAGAIAPWNTPAYAHELAELIALADRHNIPLDVPFEELPADVVECLWKGIPEEQFGGLDGFFRWLERHKYKMHVRVFTARWRSYRLCPACGGERLGPTALAFRIAGRSVANVAALSADELVRWIEQLELPIWQRALAGNIVEQVVTRLRYLQEVGLGFLSLDRTLRTLSAGEMQRVSMTSALGSTLTSVLYVLDEPSTGLHPADIERLRSVIDRLHHRGNTIVMVEHDAELVLSAQRVVEIGPGAGEQGGEIVFDGTPAELLKSDTLTADYLVGRRGRIDRPQRRPLDRGRIKLIGARGHNLQSLTVEFPLGVFCVVSGVSGAGKSSLVRGTLYPALRRRLHRESTNALDHEEVLGAGQIDDVVLVEPAPLGRTARSNPVTYVKAFQEIRRLFAETPAAKARNILASHFSFNMPGGRCDKCQGDGSVVVDMQFLADLRVPCDQCQGRRYRDEILKVTYRQHNIAEVLELTVRQAFGFFRGQPAIQSRLKPLIDVGLDYLRLGQPASTLSGGEAQRLRLAGYLGKSKRLRTLLILDEPTTGLHMADIVQLVDVLDALLAVGHSLIVIEHNMQLMQYADWIIDLGPGAADAGGRVVAEGTPEQIAACPQSITGKYLRERLA